MRSRKEHDPMARLISELVYERTVEYGIPRAKWFRDLAIAIDKMELNPELIRFPPVALTTEPPDVFEDCWIWEGPLNEWRYGILPCGKTVHRALYLAAGEPNGHLAPHLEAHHRCFRRLCIRPRHILPLTYDEHRQVHGTGEFSRAKG